MNRLKVYRIMLNKAPYEGNRTVWFPGDRKVTSIQVKFDEKKQKEWIDIEYLESDLAILTD